MAAPLPTRTDISGTPSNATAKAALTAIYDFLAEKFVNAANGTLKLLLGAYTPSATPAFSATPTFDASTTNVFEPAPLTANVTSMTISNPNGGQTINIRFEQDSTGGRTVALPSGAKVSGGVNTTASSVTVLTMTYSARASRWEGAWVGVPA